MKIVYLPIEVKSREFDSKLLIAFELIRHGYIVYIGDRAGVDYEASLSNNIIYMAKSLSFDMLEFYKKIRKSHSKIVVLDEEGSIVGRPFFKKQLIKSMIPDFTIPYIDQYYSYGTKFTEAIMEVYPDFNRNVIFETGNPRFELHGPKYEILFEKEINSLQNDYGNFVLINTNFVMANNYLGYKEQEKILKENKDFDEDLVKLYLGMMESQKKTIKEYINLVQELANSYKELNIVLRPHPGEDLAIYSEALSNYKNVYIINKGPAYQWIMASKVFIHHDCTTGIEAVFAKKPTISFLPYGKDNSTFNLAVDGSYFIFENKEDIVLKIKDLVNVDISSLASPKINVDDLINYKKSSIDIILESLNVLDIDSEERVNKNLIRIIYDRFRIRLRWILNKYARKNGYYKKYLGITKTEIKYKLEKHNIIENQKLDIIVKRITTNTFRLSTK